MPVPTPEQMQPRPLSPKPIIILGILALMGWYFSDNTNPNNAYKSQAALERETRMANIEMMQKTITIVKSQLRAPESMEVYYVGLSENGSIVCIDYGAPNGFGGMNRSKLVAVDHTPYDKPEDWNIYCTGTLEDVTGFAKLVL